MLRTGWKPAGLRAIARPLAYPVGSVGLPSARMPPLAVVSTTNTCPRIPPARTGSSVKVVKKSAMPVQDRVRTRVYGTVDGHGLQHLHVLHLDRGTQPQPRALVNDQWMRVTEWRPKQLEHAPPGLLAAVVSDVDARKFLDRKLVNNKAYMCAVAMTALGQRPSHQPNDTTEGPWVGKQPFQLWT